jgi:cyclopropane fatty-acyl-phospholipid synthase-like methyltransferase
MSEVVNFIFIFLYFLAIVFVFLLIIFLIFNYIAPLLLRGIFYVPTDRKKLNKMLEFSSLKSGEKAADLGSGDGRLVIAFAKKGVEAHGYEINPLLVILARINIRRAGLSGKAFIHWKNFWEEDFRKFDIIAVYGFDHIMMKLEKKLKSELAPGARVVSNSFHFPNWPASKEENKVYLYEIK